MTGVQTCALPISKGYRAGAVSDASSQSQPVRTGDGVFYGAGAAANGAKIGGYFGVTATALSSLPAGHVEILLGTGSAVVPAGLAPATRPGATASPSASASAGDNGAAGTAVTVTANAKFGIPCVY